MALNKEASIIRKTSSGLGWRAFEALRTSALEISNFNPHETEENFQITETNGENGHNRYGSIHTFEDNDNDESKRQALMALELHEVFYFAPKTVAVEPKPSEFQEYYGWIRYPEGDEPELTAIAGGGKVVSRPQLIAFEIPGGAIVTMSASSAEQKGLIDFYEKNTVRLGDYVSRNSYWDDPIFRSEYEMSDGLKEDTGDLFLFEYASQSDLQSIDFY